MVAVDDEGPDAGVRESAEAVAKAQLGAYSPLGSVVDVAGDDEEGGLTFEAELDEVVEGLERCLPQRIADMGSRLRRLP